MPADPLNDAVARLARNMSICQFALGQRQPAALIAIQVQALKSAVLQAEEALADAPASAVIELPAEVMGPGVAKLLADSLGSAPDTIPDSWT